MRGPARRVLFCLLPAACCLLLGCGREGPERVVVSGSVTYRGEPLESGEIRFEPAKDSTAPMAGAAISDGKYAVDSKGGVAVGTYKIRIEAFRTPADYQEPSEAEQQGPLIPPPREQYIPAKYNRDTEMEITIDSGSGAISRDFELTD